MLISMSRVIMLGVLACCPQAFAQNPDGRTQTGDVGDALEIVMPVTALAIAWVKKDRAGMGQFGLGFATTIAATYALKRTVKKQRPDRRDDESFPSSHTAIAFHTAGYLHERYGAKWGLPAYIAASFVGYSRVHDNRHDEQDVLAGALVGFVAARYFTTQIGDAVITPAIGDGFVGVNFHLPLGSTTGD